MAQSLSNVLVHAVFSTRERRLLITSELEMRLQKYISTVCDDLGCPAIYMGGMPDHIHILVKLGRTISISDFISKIKANSSRWVKSVDPLHHSFEWQRGYGAFSVSESSRQKVIDYVANQKEHHKQVSFQEEFLLLLRRYNVPFNEKYLWD